MKIYTKKGDKGQTSLIGGKKVSKNHHRIEAYGTIDELNSFLGLVSVSLKEESDRRIIKFIQDRLFTLGAALATAPDAKGMAIPDLQEEDVTMLENQMDEINLHLPELKNFILPGGHLSSGYCHVARCVCRRAERLVVALSETEPVAPLIIPYLNRLSDYLFVLARKCSKDYGSEEIIWNPREK